MSSLSNSLHSYLPNAVNQYIDQIPANTPKAILIGAAGSFVIGTAFSGGNPLVGLAKAAWGAVAVVIYAAITPLFKDLLGKNHILSDGQELCRAGISVIATGCIAALCGNPNILEGTLTALVIHFLRLNLDLGWYENAHLRNLNYANWLMSF
jgi:hypothetical protein